MAAPAVAADEDDVEEEQEGADGGDGDDCHAREAGPSAGLVPVSDVTDGRRTWRDAAGENQHQEKLEA